MATQNGRGRGVNILVINPNSSKALSKGLEKMIEGLRYPEVCTYNFHVGDGCGSYNTWMAILHVLLCEIRMLICWATYLVANHLFLP